MLALTACGGGGAQEGKDRSGSAAVDGNPDAAAIYKQQCLSCHAADLSGKVGPNLQKVGAKLTKEQIAGKIEAGGGGMPAFKSLLNGQQIDTLASWLADKK
ncbi:cytochrome c [Paenibacillus sp. P26]|nr:cytochrome c [Paenibacillus sp. P26]UUZ97472.1 cytochrome c [Paenibacillus sp. P25]